MAGAAFCSALPTVSAGCQADDVAGAGGAVQPVSKESSTDVKTPKRYHTALKLLELIDSGDESFGADKPNGIGSVVGNGLERIAGLVFANIG